MIKSLLLFADPSVRESIEANLTSAGYLVRYVENLETAKFFAVQADAMVVQAARGSLLDWCRRIRSWQDRPLFWWCDREHSPDEDLHHADIDGILFSDMNQSALLWSFTVGVMHHRRKVRLQQERDQLLSRLEERKWIDQAKGILSSLKQISEDEAYDFLRKQAMNERKKMADVARSIVNVYQLIREQDSGTSRKTR